MNKKEQAIEFFKQLEEFSHRYLDQVLRLQNTESPWGSDQFDNKKPKGAILHFTADPDFNNLLRWFVKSEFAAKTSAHVVVADRQMGSQNMLCDGLPLIEALPTCVVQCRNPYQTAWHATWTNDICYGIECINAGELRTPDNGNTFTWWPKKDENSPDWTKVWNSPYKKPVYQMGKWWDSYPSAQIKTIIILLRYLNDLYEGQLQPEYILGHEQVQSVATLKSSGLPMKTDKRDPGPSFPLNELRISAFATNEISNYPWFKSYTVDLKYGENAVNQEISGTLQLFSGVPGNPDIGISKVRFLSAIDSLIAKPSEPFGVWGKLGLSVLGYYIPSIKNGIFNNVLDPTEIESIKIFQRMSGLTSDGDPGINTRAALAKRLRDRGIL